MLQVSMGALVSLVIIMLVCFVLPFLLFYILYRYADGRVKTFLIGAVAYLVTGVIIDTSIAALFDQLGGIKTNNALYLLYAVVFSPICFVLVNYLIIKRFGKDNMKTTGDSFMYSLGYSSALNILSTGLLALMYFLSLLEIKNKSGSLIVVSDADYVSMSDVVSGSNLVNETIYQKMSKLCAEPVSYYMVFIVKCLWVIVALSAIMMVIGLAVKKVNKLILLAFAFVIRLFITLPDIFDRFNVIKNVWISQLISVIILVIVWVAAFFCRRMFIDTEDSSEEEKEKVN